MVFRISCDGGTLEMYDGIERRTTRFTVKGWLGTNNSYEFRFPVDRIFSAKCQQMEYTAFLTFLRRVRDYELIVKLEYGNKHILPRDEYIIEVDAHCKVYLHVRSSLKFECTTQGLVSLEFEPNAELVFGIRSYHRRPGATIYTTQDIRDLAKAVSLLSSSIKVDNCERSYQTLRGHPPLIEFADEFSAGVKKKDSDVEIIIPPRLDYLYVVAPLAYYLLADIGFGSPTIKSDAYEQQLPKLPRFEDEVNEILRRVFFLDCLVRNAGLYKLDLQELKALEGVNAELDDLYSMSIGQQLSFYLGIPMKKLRQYMPRWHLSSYVEPVAERAKGLPFLLDKLSAIYLPRSKSISQRDVSVLAVKDLLRGDVFDMAREKTITQPLVKDSDSHLWLAKKEPLNITKATEEAFYNRLKYAASTERIRVALIVNDEDMLLEEDMIQMTYAARGDVPLKAAVYNFLEKDELAEIFAEGYDLVHYIGHCDEKGLQCRDGSLKTRDIPLNRTPAFFLNACKSYEEGQDLIKTGSVGGIVTVYYVPNEQALRIGYNFSRLLTLGFSIEKAMDIAKTGTLSGRDYLILGDGSYSLMQNPRMNATYLYDIHRVGEDKFQVIDKNYGHGYYTGGYFYSDLNGEYHLCPGEVCEELSSSELIGLLEKTITYQPVIYENKLIFADDFQKRLKNKIEGEFTPSTVPNRCHRQRKRSQ